MKIEIELKETVKKEIEIEFPYFSKSSIYYYKIMQNDKMIRICCFGGNQIESFDFWSNNAFPDESVEITAKEFDAKFDEIVTLIKNHE